MSKIIKTLKEIGKDSFIIGPISSSYEYNNVIRLLFYDMAKQLKRRDYQRYNKENHNSIRVSTKGTVSSGSEKIYDQYMKWKFKDYRNEQKINLKEFQEIINGNFIPKEVTINKKDDNCNETHVIETVSIEKDRLTSAYKQTNSNEIKKFCLDLFGDIFPDLSCKVGDRLINKYDKEQFIVAQFTERTVALVSLKDGSRFCLAKEVHDQNNISDREVKMLLGDYYNKFEKA